MTSTKAIAQKLKTSLMVCNDSSPACGREDTNRTDKAAVHVCLSCCLLHDSLVVLVRGLDEVGGRLQGGVWPAKGALIGVRPAAIHAFQSQNCVQDLAACCCHCLVVCTWRLLHSTGFRRSAGMGRVHSSVLCIAEDCKMC